jgi:5-methylcytosine-specific restriction endonuclease McrA
MKRCSKCEAEKPLEEFGRQGAKYRAFCKSCQRAYQRSYVAENRETVLERKRQQSREYRVRHPERDRAYRERMKDRRREYRRDYYESNPDRIAAKRRAYYEANREGWALRARARRRKMGRPDAQTLGWIRLIRNDPCAYCGAVGGGTVDHIVPISRGGRNHWANLTGACGSCNDSKGNRPLLQWILAKAAQAAEGEVA